MNAVRSFCKEFSDHCFAMFGKKKETEYSNVSHNPNDENIHPEDDEESFSAWPSKSNSVTVNQAPSGSLNATSSASTQASRTSEKNSYRNTNIEMETKPIVEHRPILIGNLEEETLPKKKLEVVDDDADELFAKMNMNGGPVPTLKINKTVVNAGKDTKNTSNKLALDKFKMDEDLAPSGDGWADDGDITI